MELAELARYQRRLQYLQTLVDNNEVTNEDVRLKLVDTMKTYRNLLARCWENNEVTEANLVELNDLNRKLQALHEESRVKMSV